MDRSEIIQIARECMIPNPVLYVNELEQFAQRIQPQWLPIESAPKDQPIMLLADEWFGVGFWQDPYWISGHSTTHRCENYMNVHYAFSVNATHWMPLPKPPEDTT